MTILKNPILAPESDVAALDDRLLSMWRRYKFDTTDMARALDKPESVIANRVAALRDAGRR